MSPRTSNRRDSLPSCLFVGDRRYADFIAAFERLRQSTRLECRPDVASAEPALWLPEAGRGELEGTLYLAPEDVSADLRLRLEDVVSPGASKWMAFT